MSRKEKLKKYDKERYEYYKKRGICVNCYQHEATQGVLCVVCAEEKNARERNAYSKLTAEEKAENNAKCRSRYQRLKEAGLCVKCGQRPTYNGKVHCKQCYIKARRHTVKINEKRRKGYRDLGLCLQCGKPVVKGYKLCEEHLEKKRATLAENRKKNKGKGWQAKPFDCRSVKSKKGQQ